jgi:hypothetical protein
MGFFDELGEFVGSIVGGVVGGAVSGVGELVDSDFLRESGESIYNVTKATGETLGQAAQGVADVACGVVSSDSSLVDEGLDKIGDTVTNTINGIGNGIGYVAENGANLLEGLNYSDSEQIMDSAKNLGKVAFVGALSFGVLDALDVVGDDGIDTHQNGVDNMVLENTSHEDIAYNDSAEITQVVSTEEHFVQPHHVSGYVKDDGTVVEAHWRDGDGNTDIDRTVEEGGGYFANNPVHKG